jgi:hypothetical protein
MEKPRHLPGITARALAKGSTILGERPVSWLRAVCAGWAPDTADVAQHERKRAMIAAGRINVA